MNRIETNDLFKSAYFLTRSCRLVETRINGNDQVRFLLEGENIEEEEQMYLCGQAVTNPLHLKESLNFLRQLLNQTLQTRNQNPKRRTHEQNFQAGD